MTAKPLLTTTKLIVLDPGHGSTRGVLGYDPGACDGQRTEADANVEAALTLKSLLVGKGCRVVLTHDGNDGPKPDLNWRVRMAAALHADAFISLHYDMKFTPGKHLSGVYSAPGTASKKFAEAILPALRECPGRWCKPSSHSRFNGLYIDAFPDQKPAVLVELDSIQFAPLPGQAGREARLEMLRPLAEAIVNALR